jgi:uncharacterized protein (TIRG00374 family)
MAFWKKKQFWGMLIGIALLAYCLKDIRMSQMEKLVERLNFDYLIPSIVSTFLFVILRGLRWRILVHRQKQIGVTRSVTLYSAGQVLNMIMPVLTGQVGRLILYAKKEGLRKTFVFSTMILEVVFDAVTLIIFMFLTSLAFVFPSEYRYVSFRCFARASTCFSRSGFRWLHGPPTCWPFISCFTPSGSIYRLRRRPRS